MPEKREVKKKSKRDVGATAETKASSFLQKKGYKIVVKNFSTRFGEIDIIGKKDGVMYLIEVKYKKSARFGFPVEAVGKRKLERIKKTGQFYIKQNDLSNLPFKIIVISILNDRIKLIKVESW